MKKFLKKIGIIGIVKKIYWKINYTYSYKLNNKKLKGLKIYQTKTENSELWMGQLLTFVLKNYSGSFIDVGVNIGQTLCQVKSIDWERKYYGFEPNPACNMFVEELIRINKFTNAKVFPVGLYTKDTIFELDLYYDDITNSGGSIIKDYWAFNNKKPERTLIVPLMSFETITKSVEIKNVGIIKIDVEGAEVEVLESLENCIKKDRPIIIIEILSAYSNDNTIRIERQNKIIAFITSMEYNIYRIIEDKNQKLERLMQIEYFDPLFDHNQCNYILVPKENMNEFVINMNSYFNFSL